MTALEQLQNYLRRVEMRLRLAAGSRGVAIIGGLALTLTVVLVWVGNQYRFAQNVVTPLRILLFLALGTAIALGLAAPLLKLNRKRATHLAELRIPGFQERLLTVTEKADPANPFTELLAEDALRVSKDHNLDAISPGRWLVAFFAAGTAATLVLLWLIAAGPGYWGYGASLLWTGSASVGRRPLYEVLVQPGDKTVRRRSDQAITARVQGFSAQSVTLHARYGNAPKWEETVMQPSPQGNGYQFLFAGLSDQVEYYVQADFTKSKTYTLAVKDLPGVKRVRVTLHYPASLGLRDEVQEPGGDIRAVEGTQADIAVLTDRPLEHGALIFDNGSKLDLTRVKDNWLTARLTVGRDGSYHVAALDAGEAIRISDDYFIESKKDEAPSVRIVKPGRDPKVTPIEEVPVAVEASDDFGIEGMDLHYSVNGGAEQVVPMLKAKGTKEAAGSTMLYLENFKLAPGDLVSFYATAKDANTTSRTEIFFAQAEPFDFKFSQSQQVGGGGMGMGNQESDISNRQKQIIAATWNEVRDKGKAKGAAQEEARFLAETEGKLGEQAKVLAERMGDREMAGANSQFAGFSKLMTDASGQMNDAVAQLKSGKWNDSLGPEQKALQSLLRAESLFRDIQVAFGQSSGSGGSGGAQRDLARMFDLELDTSKNQYETGQKGGDSGDSQQKAVDEAFQRLQDLARRQQQLAEQSSQQQAMEQRWQEEQLRREAEELRKQIEQLAQSQQQQGSQQGKQQSGSQSSSSGGQQSASGQQRQGSQSGSGDQQQKDQQNRATADAMRRAGGALQRAEDEMRKAVSEHDATAQRRAAAQLAEAQDLLNKALHQEAGQSVADLARRAQEIASAQRDIANKMKDLYGSSAGSQNQQGFRFSGSGEGEDGMPEMNDPTNPRYNGYRRRAWQPPQPSHLPTEQEKALANEKEQLAKRLEQLQRQMQQQEQNMASTQPGAASKMRRALSDAEQKELALRMEKNAEWMKQGFGERNLDTEDKVTAGLDQLSRDLRDVQQALNSGDKNGPAGDQQQAQALAQIQQLRQTLQRAQNGHGRQSDSLSRQGEQGGQPGQDGQQSGQQPGQQQGGRNGGQIGQDGQFSEYGGGPPTVNRSDIREAIGQLSALRGQLDPRDRAMRGYLDDSLGYLRSLYADPSVLQTTINRDAVVRLERLEVELEKRVGEQQRGQGARTGPAEASPEKYRDAVAEYFKKLSQPK